MRLKIVQGAKESLANKSTDFELPPVALQRKGTHLFIKAHSWDSIEVDLTDDIPEGSLIYLHMCTNSLKVNLPTEITSHTMRLLCEIYPELKGRIRKTFLTKGDMHDVLREVR